MSGPRDLDGAAVRWCRNENVSAAPGMPARSSPPAAPFTVRRGERPARRALLPFRCTREPLRLSPMIRRLLLATVIALASCRPVNQLDRPRTTPVPAGGFAMTDALSVADRHRVAAIANRRINHADYWSALQPSLVSQRLKVDVIGRSMMGRELRAITFGTGPTKILLWSQMHGDEATATMALADILAWMTASTADGIRDRIASSLTAVMIPMLNPDGAERFQRENAVGIDVNRDARRLATPEARALKAVHEK